MARGYRLQVRLTEQERERLQAEADRRGISMSEVIQDYIKRLPKPERERQDSVLNRDFGS